MSEKALRMGEVYRYARPYDPAPPNLEGYKNYFSVTHTPGMPLPLLDSGISPIGMVHSQEGPRRPAILISSSPHKIGSAETPWQDFFDTDNGHIHYFGDNKSPVMDPSGSPGNKALLEAYRLHSAFEKEKRKYAVPLIFFRRVPKAGRRKGFVRFEGFGIVERVELVTQYDRAKDRTFTNYAFDFLVMSLAQENERFDWEWITIRRNHACSQEHLFDLAPASWKIWVRSGQSAFGRCRRSVSKLMTFTAEEQRAVPGSRAAKALEEIYDYYRNRKSRFEALAALVAEHTLSGTGGSYRVGWITPPSSDGGADFIGRLEVGSGFASTQLVVLGQAKCEKPDKPTGGNHIARTVARLKRGWIGVYVTTSYFSEPVQREVIEDQYPIVLINGRKLAEEVLSMAHEGGYAPVKLFLDYVDNQYENMIQARRPEEILLAQ